MNEAIFVLEAYGMKAKIDLTEAIFSAWKTSNQVSVYLVRNIPRDLWNGRIPGYPRKTIGMLAIHLHNSRCMWIKSIEKGNSKERFARLDPRHATRKETLAALKQSHKAMLNLITNCINHGGQLPSRPAWLNFPGDVIHLLFYFVAHEAHHRGQMIMAARQLDRPLTREMSGELWQWKKRLKESGAD